jgi:colanic acid biosynthesis glycosyl transferase WcaI
MTVSALGNGMRIVVHDYGAYPFQTQLSRELTARGHNVLHLHAAGWPRGPIQRRTDDAPTFTVEAINIGEPFRGRRSPRRLLQELRYGRLLSHRIAAFDPDVVVSANAPLDVQAAALAQAHRRDAGFIFWIQDIHSIAIHRILARRQAIASRLLAARFSRLERRLLRASDAIVAITDDFLPILSQWGVPRERTSIVENWAPLDEVAPLLKANKWSAEHGLTEMPVFLYAGTLGLKHNPAMLLALAEGLPSARVVVISEGTGAQWLRRHATGAQNLLILPFQPLERLREVFASADVLVAILEPDAGVFSVPSKVYTYLAASRPILGAIPEPNLAARTINYVGAGRVVEPGDVQGFLTAARALLDDPKGRALAGAAGRGYAESAFEIGGIADRFEAIMRACARPRRKSQGAPAAGAVSSANNPTEPVS